MAIAVGDRSRAVARSHAESAEHTASGVASSPLGCQPFHSIAARCEPNSAHRVYCLRGRRSRFWRLFDAICRQGAVIDWHYARDTRGEPMDPRRRGAYRAHRVGVAFACDNFHQQCHAANRQCLTFAVTSWRSLSRGAR